MPGACLLVHVGTGPEAEELLHSARALAGRLNALLLAVYIEGPPTVNEWEKTRADRSLALARELGAEVITTTDDDFVRGLLRVAGQRNVTHIVVGKARQGPWLKRWQRRASPSRPSSR